MIESKLNARGQTTIPKAVRVRLNLRAGDRIRYEFDDSGVRLVPLRSVLRLAGSLQYDGVAKTLDDMESGIIAGATKN